MDVIKASLHRISLLAFLCLLNACAATGVREVTHNTQLPRYAELTNTPFFFRNNNISAARRHLPRH